MDGESQPADLLDQDAAEVLAGRICAQAAVAAEATCVLLELVGDFDAGGGLAFMHGAKSVAHWISYSCSMAPGTAREHVRVARALREMPTVAAAFRAGELSYSKVRETTRVVGLVDEQRLCALARATSASQLARTVRGFRAATGTRMPEQDRRRLRVGHRDDGSAGVSGRMPAEEAALVAAALRKARDLHAEPPDAASIAAAGDQDADGRGTPEFTDVDALLEVCRHYLDTADGTDSSGEDRQLVVVEVAADQLAGPPLRAASDAATGSADDVGVGESAADPDPIDGDGDGDVFGRRVPEAVVSDVPAGTSGQRVDAADRDAPAGTSDAWTRGQICRIRGVGGIEPATAQRLACTGTLLGAIVDDRGDVLALGRTRRLVSKAQRRALMIRDGSCRFPGCTSRTHLQAHHRISWSSGGRTDLDNLLLLCQFHHTTVHEGGITITRSDSGAWEFLMPDGEPVASTGWRVPTAERLTRHLAEQPADGVDDVDSYSHPDAIRIRPQQYGERFSLHDAVQALFTIATPLESAGEQEAA